MFADCALAARLDRAEGRACAATALALRERGAPEPLVEEVGGGLAVHVRKGSPINKVIGVALGAELTELEVARLEEALRERGEAPRYELATLADPAAGALLTGRDYHLQGFENVLGLELARAPAPRGGAGVEVSLLADGEEDALSATLVEGFAAPDDSAQHAETFPREALEQVIRDSLQTPGSQRYLARIEGQVVGAGSMRLDDGIAQLTGAATLPGWRRRGVQSALLGRRLADARRAGCSLATITVAPGTQSMANALRQGYALLYARAVLIRELP
jgi:ribosomal protein S18 acetylase RimI-like enzyme